MFVATGGASCTGALHLKNKFLVSQLQKNPYLHCHQFYGDVSPTETFLRLVLVAVNYSNFNCKCFLTSIYFSLHMRVKCIFYAWVVLPRYRWHVLHW